MLALHKLKITLDALQGDFSKFPAAPERSSQAKCIPFCLRDEEAYLGFLNTDYLM
jgi:hypothetical protein